jgi:hypothetical protein
VKFWTEDTLTNNMDMLSEILNWRHTYQQYGYAQWNSELKTHQQYGYAQWNSELKTHLPTIWICSVKFWTEDTLTNNMDMLSEILNWRHTYQQYGYAQWNSELKTHLPTIWTRSVKFWTEDTLTNNMDTLSEILNWRHTYQQYGYAQWNSEQKTHQQYGYAQWNSEQNTRLPTIWICSVKFWTEDTLTNNMYTLGDQQKYVWEFLVVWYQAWLHNHQVQEYVTQYHQAWLKTCSPNVIIKCKKVGFRK